MGFGLLIAGYMMLFSIPLRSVGISIELIGYLLILRALSPTLLGQYQDGFRRARYAVWALLPLGGFSLGLQLVKLFGYEALYQTIYSATELIYSVLLAVALLVFHYFLYDGVEHQARDVELFGIVKQAKYNRIVTAIYFALTVALNFLNIPAVTDIIAWGDLVAVISLFGIVWILLSAKMLFACYMRICLPGDEDMPMPEDGKSLGLPSLFGIKKKEKYMTEEEKAEKDREQKERQRAAYAAEMRRRQEAKTKKNKRGRRR